MSQVEITFTIDGEGKSSLRIKGVRGKACRPIHAAVSEDLNRLLGVTELSAEDTAEARDIPNVVTQSAAQSAAAGR